MNASMNDSHNLGNELNMFEMWCVLTECVAWKLVQVLRGRASLSLLQTVSLLVYETTGFQLASFSTNSSAENTHKI